MSYLERDQDTIFALSTPPGRGGIAVIRVSGPKTLEVVKKNCKFLVDKEIESHKAYFGNFRSAKNNIIDEVLATFFAEGRSFTGQESIEISCHGSPVIISAISDELLNSGARIAERGEFTYRAFMNGKMDLVQAESVLSLIESKTRSAARMATRHLQGELSQSYEKLESDITWALANMEAGIDFSTEDITPYDLEELLGITEACEKLVTELLQSYAKGRIVQEGLNIALVGKPNVGKSSLLNALSKKEHAIVTEVAGTTRDLVHAELSVNGVMVKLTDTAGLRLTEDVVEKIGIAKTKEAMKEADMVFFLVDAANLCAEDFDVEFEDEKTVLIANKIDLNSSWQASPEINSKFERSIKASAAKNEGLDEIMNFIEEEVSDLLLDDAPVVSNSRHVEKLKVALTALEKTNKLLKEEASPEFLSFELQCALLAIKEILGKTYDDQVMDKVFQEFCIGK